MAAVRLLRLGRHVRVGTDGDPLRAGTKLPAGQTFVFGKNAGDYTGTADASYNFQVTEAGGFQIRDAGASPRTRSARRARLRRGHRA